METFSLESLGKKLHEVRSVNIPSVQRPLKKKNITVKRGDFFGKTYSSEFMQSELVYNGVILVSEDFAWFARRLWYFKINGARILFRWRKMAKRVRTFALRVRSRFSECLDVSEATSLYRSTPYYPRTREISRYEASTCTDILFAVKTDERIRGRAMSLAIPRTFVDIIVHSHGWILLFFLFLCIRKIIASFTDKSQSYNIYNVASFSEKWNLKLVDGTADLLLSKIIFEIQTGPFHEWTMQIFNSFLQFGDCNLGQKGSFHSYNSSNPENKQIIYCTVLWMENIDS